MASKGKMYDSKPQPQIDELPHEENKDEEQLSEPDDEINEQLFSRYDHMFNLYNQFGARFQETAHYIGLLIKKNMNLN